MTLHWWMHWFWVTSLLVIVAGTGRTLAAPQSEEIEQVSNLETERYAERQPRAMYFTKTPQLTTTKPPENVTQKEIPKSSVAPNVSSTTDAVQIQWTPVNITDNTTFESNPSVNATAPAVATFTNVTEAPNATFPSKKRNLTRPDYIKDGIALEGLLESRIVTEKPLSLETAFLQTRIPPNIESSRRVIDPGEGGMDTGAIAGISFAALVLAALAGSTAFILYRRRYLNKPQTLNDKCSNPDSSGYLDDSTIRDNSEEMYSLDNDSFLNSLEAMTIQNYWTDTVKHTKL
ncbi:uncharacterized protein LOC123697688 isoform X1 [Colias croceus]|uniref:uncharacterized protein LOC123697688 isoform X1 n=2 Tax=Colias crocea TaxID=72248 RepID=UPI001E27CD2F|nr:uncharacterized protein LOC123697688 isoform X1 [Colias croceus]XP_045500282.1 uncharacterized protein LOC123697688 isoform X1 [Colias croceus]